MFNTLELSFERVTYRDGQLLTSLDLNGDVERDALLRWLHTQYLHKTWGIATGFNAQRVDEGKAVQVGPGFAIDIEGRDLVLTQGVTVPAPTRSASTHYVLTMRYQGRSEYRIRAKEQPTCLKSGTNPRLEEPVFAWEEADRAEFGLWVPLVSAQIVNGRIQSPLGMRVRRHVQPLVRPHIGSGRTEAGRTGWQMWLGTQQLTGVEVTVDTSAAGFVATPAYFPMLYADLGHMVGLPTVDSASSYKTTLSPSMFNFVTAASATSFTYRVIGIEVELTPELAEQREWYLSWVGLEPVRGCEPAIGDYRPYSATLLELLPLTQFSVI